MSGRISWAAFVGAFAIFVASAWPGWMSIDSIGMFEQATGGPIYDWHSPILTWAWRHLGASALGPLIPFLLQASLFWGGLLLVVARLQRLGWRTSWLIFPGVLLLDATWTVAWLWKDSLELGIMMMMIGLAASTDIARRKHLLWPAIGLLAAALVATRWYIAPLVLVALATLACMANPVPRRQILVTLAVFGIASVSFYGFEKAVIKPEPSYVSGSLMMLDIARVECNIGSAERRAQGDSLFPEELIRQVPNDDICARFTTYAHDPLYVERDQEVTQTSYVLPDSDASMSRLTDAWVDVAKLYTGVLVEARFKQMLAFLNSESGMWWSPSVLLPTNTSIYPEDSMGEGDAVSWGSSSGAPLVLTATASYVGRIALLDFGAARFGLLVLILIPLGTAVAGWRRGPGWRVRYLPALGFPLLFAASMAVVVPAADVRYVMPVAFWSLAIAALAIVDRRAGSDAGARRDSPDPT